MTGDKPKWTYSVPGIPDEFFERVERIPMTKEEIRALVISKLRLGKGHKAIDVGCGTGSVTVEMALAVGNGLVYAVDRDKEAVELTRRNAERFGVLDKVVIIHGEAPEALAHVPNGLNAGFIGGSGGKLREIVAELRNKLVTGGRLVIDAITLENATQAIKSLEEMGFTNIEVTEAIIAKGLKTNVGYVMLARNPIFIISGEKG